jgi:hypothetical protein
MASAPCGRSFRSNWPAVGASSFGRSGLPASNPWPAISLRADKQACSHATPACRLAFIVIAYKIAPPSKFDFAMTFSRASSAALLFLALAPGMARAADDLDFFEKKVRPILVERCLECHSSEKKIKGGLALDSRAGWEAGGDAGPAIVPGKPDESLLVKAVRYTDPDLQMPEKRKLPDAEIAILEEWVRRGAPDPRSGAAVAKKQEGMSVQDGRKFWAYVTPKKPAVPPVADRDWPRNAIDHFILAKLEQAKLKPGKDADSAVLARRLSFNLTGLPPSRDTMQLLREQGIGKAAATLLESPQFGEHWGRHWLDVARFAESSGGGRTLLFKDAWRYRDYVIEALNAGVPYDQFLREQIAGDLLPHRDAAEERRHLTATAFLALGPTNYEEQDKQQLRFDVIDEQLDTIGKTVMGQTVGCARCHDHKFDPIPQRDYYALAGIFASTRTLYNYTDNVARWVASPLPMEKEQEEKLQAHEQQVAALKASLDAAKKDAGKRSVAKSVNDPAGPIAATALAGIVVDDDDAKIVGDWKPSTNFKTYIGTGYRTDDAAEKGSKTLTFVPKLPKAGRYEVRLAYTAAPNRATAAPVHVLHADGEADLTINQQLEPPLEARFVSLGTFRFEKDGANYVMLSNEGTKGHVIADAVQFLPEEEAASETAGNERPAVVDATARVKELEAQMKALVESGPKRPTVMTVREVPEDIGDTQLRVRGLVNQKGAAVPRGFLTVCAHTEPREFTKEQSGRKEFAEWLTSRDHPLTARVFVNRVWHWLFGQGLVRTVDNFGTTGEAPSHPELLDYLAVEFMDRGWNVKWLIAEIVTSRAWQLATGREPTDPDNRLVSHANRRRLTAEQLRDTMLSASGELDLRLFGPNILGAGDINANDTSAQNVEYAYQFRDLRRSVYTPAFRARRLELFEVFDFANINAPLGARGTSNVAPQALYLLNHPWVLARAESAAQRILATQDDDAVRLERAVEATLGRPPTPAERRKFQAHLAAAPDARLGWTELYQTLFACMDFRYLE